VSVSVSERKKVLEKMDNNPMQATLHHTATLQIPLDGVIDLVMKRTQLEKARALAHEQSRQFLMGRGIIANIISGYVGVGKNSILPYFPSIFAFAITHCGSDSSVLLTSINSSSPFSNDPTIKSEKNSLPIVFRHLLLQLLGVLVDYQPRCLVTGWKRLAHTVSGVNEFTGKISSKAARHHVRRANNLTLGSSSERKGFIYSSRYQMMWESAHSLLESVINHYSSYSNISEPWPVDWRWDSYYYPSFNSKTSMSDPSEENRSPLGNIRNRSKNKSLTPKVFMDNLDPKDPIPLPVLIFSVVVLLLHSPKAVQALCRDIVQWATASESPSVCVAAIRVYRALLLSFYYLSGVIKVYNSEAEMLKNVGTKNIFGARSTG
jgi:hypothetical protein